MVFHLEPCTQPCNEQGVIKVEISMWAQYTYFVHLYESQIH